MRNAEVLKISSLVLFWMFSTQVKAQEQNKPSERSYHVILTNIKNQLAKRKVLRANMQLPEYNQPLVSGNTPFIQSNEKQLNDKPVLVRQEQMQKKPSERQMPVPVRKEVIRDIPRN